ncbi:MAG: glycosyltransferase family 9 protein [Deltaproteobacteria bacterium]|nr:glycosyltransferase family 9 protein [Deltaproteobacteria bacterium]
MVYDPPQFAGNKLRALVETATCLIRLRQKRFDTALILHRTSVAGLFAKMAGIQRRIGFDYDGSGKYLTEKVYFRKKKHEVDRYLDLATPLGIETESCDPTTEVFVSQESEAHIDALMEANEIDKDRLMVAICAGGGKNPGTLMLLKRWIPEGFVETAKYLIQELDVAVVFVGGSGDEKVTKWIMERIPGKAYDLVGKTTFAQLASLLKRCALFIGGDTGPLHIAAGVGTPTIALFGPSDPRLVAPRGKKHIHIWKGIDCSPCYYPDTSFRKSSFSCNEGFECMRSITTEDVVDSIKKLLG